MGLYCVRCLLCCGEWVGVEGGVVVCCLCGVYAVFMCFASKDRKECFEPLIFVFTIDEMTQASNRSVFLLLSFGYVRSFSDLLASSKIEPWYDRMKNSVGQTSRIQ